MPSYNYSFHGWDFRPLSFPPDRMDTIGRAAVDSSRARIASGLNAADSPTTALSAQYAKRKVRAGQPPIRNWRLTGALLAGMGVQQSQENSVSIGFTSVDAVKLQDLAAWNNNVERIAGISPRDEANVAAVMQAEFSEEIAERNK
jgi:hypothetical protein